MGRGHEVAILIDDLSTAQAISKTIRLTGVIPHFYESLKSFWFGSIENPPSIVLVDVLQMSQGELALADHPLVRDRSMELVFYYTAQTAPLLGSTYELEGLGNICGDVDLAGQVKSVLDRYNRQVMFQEQISLLEEKQRSFLSQIEEGQREQQRLQIRDLAQHQLVQLCQSFSARQKNKNFFEVCEQVFKQSNLIQRYAMVELAPGEQRAVSYKGQDQKIINFEQLWLGKKCDNGLELFAQNLITQVAMESFSQDLVILGISSFRGNPDRLIFIEPSAEIASNFDWDFLEHHLSGIYARFELFAQREGMRANRQVDSWQMLEILDREFFALSSSQGNLKIVDLDFSMLLAAIKTRPDVRFFWDRFIEEFKLRLSLSLDFEYQLSDFGARHMSLACSSTSTHWFEQIKLFVEGFPFWRFFENAQTIMGMELTPQVRMIPASAEAYLNYLDHKEVLYTKHSMQSEAQVDTVVMSSRVKQWSEPRISF